jgi:hypothetical protein
MIKIVAVITNIEIVTIVESIILITIGVRTTLIIIIVIRLLLRAVTVMVTLPKIISKLPPATILVTHPPNKHSFQVKSEKLKWVGSSFPFLKQ